MTERRWDLTQDRRFTLSTPSQALLKEVKYLMNAEILLTDEVPSGFRRLKEEAKQLLHSMREKNPRLTLISIALSKTQKSEKILKHLRELGITPTQLRVKREDTRVEKCIFPWIVLRYSNREVAILMLNAQQGVSPERQLNDAAQVLEYKLSNAIRQLCVRDKPKIAFYHGEGETRGARIETAKASLRRFYRVDDFRFQDTTALRSRFDSLLQYKALVINNPQSRFPENAKYLIDQYVQHRGRILWAINAVEASPDSLRASGRELAYVKDLNLTDRGLCTTETLFNISYEK